MIPFGAIGAAAFAMRGNRNADPTVANIVLRTFGAALFLPLSLMAVAAHPLFGAPCLLVTASLLLPSLFLTRVLVPLGMPRAAYVFARISPPIAISTELEAGAVLYAALAAHRAKTFDAALNHRLEVRLALPLRVRSIAVTPHAMLAALRGENEAARALFAGVDALPWRAAPRLPRRIARTWLVADAAERGDWRLAAALGCERRSTLLWGYAVGRMAERLLGEATAPSDPTLWILWLLAPHRRATLPLLRRALGVARAADVAIAAREGDPLEAALRARDAFLHAPTARSALACARAWDAAAGADASLRARIARRALALETPASPETVLARLQDSAARAIAPYVCRVPAHLIATSATLGAAAEIARREELDEIEEAAQAFGRRTTDKTELHVLHEWAELAILRRRCARVRRLAGAEARRAAFQIAYSKTCNHAVWLFNVRGEKLLAHGAFRWLLEEVRAVNGSAETVALLQKNVKAGYGA